MSNIIPIPTVKVGEISSRKNMHKIIKKKDPIHDVIEEYNRLLKITRMKKTKPKIGIKGKNFTKSPTLEELMGIKIPSVQKERKYQIDDENEIDEDIFIEWNDFYKKHMKKDVHITRRLLAGIKQDDRFNLGALTKFYAIFINRVAPIS